MILDGRRQLNRRRRLGVRMVLDGRRQLDGRGQLGRWMILDGRRQLSRRRRLGVRMVLDGRRQGLEPGWDRASVRRRNAGEECSAYGPIDGLTSVRLRRGQGRLTAPMLGLHRLFGSNERARGSGPGKEGVLEYGGREVLSIDYVRDIIGVYGG